MKKIARTFVFACSLVPVPCFLALRAQAEEWGFSFSGQILEVVDGVKSVAKKGGSADYVTDVWIRLYDDSEGTSAAKAGAIWGRRIRDVHVKNGTFSCELRDSAGDVLPASHTNLQDAVAQTLGSTVTVGVTPFGDEYNEIDPRQRLSAVPFAVNAGDTLGASGDIAIGGTLTTGAASVPAVTFGGAVTHRGDVLFSSDPRFPSLALADDERLEAKRVAVNEAVSVSTVEAGTLRAAEAKALVGAVAAASFENLSVRGRATPAAVTSAGDTLTVEGDLTAKESIAVTNFVFGGGVDLFDWDNGPDPIVKLEGVENETQASKYTITGNGGYWTPPADQMDGHLLMSISFTVEAGDVTVKVDGLTVGVLSSSAASCLMPLQVVVPVGKKIEWDGTKTVEVRYRKFRF